MNYSRTLASMIDQSAGKMLTVTFVKQDGTERVLNGRIGVTKHIKGSSLNKKPADYITMYDVKNKGYRQVNRSSIVAIRCNGIEAVTVR